MVIFHCYVSLPGRVITGIFFAVQYSELTERQARIELLEKSKVGFPSMGYLNSWFIMEDPKIKIDDLEKQTFMNTFRWLYSGFNDF